MTTRHCILLTVTVIINIPKTISEGNGILFGHEITADYNHGHVHIFMTSHDVSFQACTIKCFQETKCDFVNYLNRLKVCYLIEHFNSDFEATALFSSKEGSVLGVKKEWQMSYLNASHPAVTIACGPPLNIPYAERHGNMYTAGSKVVFKCTKSQDRNTSATCSSLGQWENQGLLCYPDQCYTNGDLWVHNDYCYVFFWNTTVNEPDAKAMCTRLNGHLPLIKYQEKQEYVEDILKSYVESGEYTRSDRPNSWVWIGLSDTDQEDVFKWTGEATPTDFLNWFVDEGEPNGANYQNCVVLGPKFNYKWADVSCDDERFLTLCEINISDQCYTNDDLWVHNDYCYVFFWNTTVNEPDAKEMCTSLNGHLPLIKNQERQEYIENILKSYVESGEYTRSDRPNSWVWIGLSDTDQEDVFKWTGEATPTEFLNWFEGEREPNGANYQNCVVLGPKFNYKWADVSCDDERFLTLCEINISGDYH